MKTCCCTLAVLLAACNTAVAESQSQGEGLKIGLFADRGCSGNGLARWAELIDRSPDARLLILSGKDIAGGGLKGLDLLVMPGGRGDWYYESLGDDGAQAIRDYVADGGKYFGTCCGIAAALNEDNVVPKRLKMLPFKRVKAPNRGGFTATVAFNEKGKSLLGLSKDKRKIRYHDGPVLAPAEAVSDCSEVEVLATMDCELAESGPVIGKMYGTPAAVWARYGKGKMLAFNCHPEIHDDSLDIVAAGIRALTGRSFCLAPPREPKGRTRIGFRTQDLGAKKGGVKKYLRLVKDPEVFVVPLTEDEIREGYGAVMDRIVSPEDLPDAAPAHEVPATAAKIDGPFPLLCTPYTESGEVDYEVLAKETRFVAEAGAHGIIWPAAEEAIKLLTPEEERKGWETIAGVIAEYNGKANRQVWFCPCCPGTNLVDTLRRLKTAHEVAERTTSGQQQERTASGRQQVPATALVRMCNDAKTDDDYRRQYEAIAELGFPIILQTYNGKSPMPSAELLIDLAKKYPDIYGWYKVEGTGKDICPMMEKLVAAKPAVKTVFTGWGGRDWLYQYRRIGTRGVISQRPMYADLMVRVWEALEKGKNADELFAKFMYLRNLDNVLPSANMRGWNLYVLKKRGIFKNTLSRESDGKGGCKLVDTKLTPAMIAEIDARLEYALVN